MVGVQLQGDAETRKRKRLILIHGQKDKKTSKRKTKTGIKHCGMNMIRVLGQGFMDNSPSQVIFLPIMKLEEVLNFKDQSSFTVAILCGNSSVYQEMVFFSDY